MQRLPTVFVSHGPPTLAIEESPVATFLRGLGRTLPRPRAILCVSAHWETASPAVSAAVTPETIYDFYGFPDPLYRLTYPAPGAPELAARVAKCFAEAGMDCAQDRSQGLDHGAWIPLLLAYPDAAIPVAQVAIQHARGAAHHVALGRALAPLRDEGVLIFASGNTTHNLRDALAHLRSGRPAAPPAWASAFDAWTAERVSAGDLAALTDYRAQAPHAAMAHPRDEHFLPLLVAAGAAEGEPGRVLHASFMAGSLSMAAYAFG